MAAASSSSSAIRYSQISCTQLEIRPNFEKIELPFSLPLALASGDMRALKGIIASED